MPEPEVNDPSPELAIALKKRTQLIAAIESLKERRDKSVGQNRRRIDSDIEGLERRIRKSVSLTGSMLKDEGFPEDYELPEDDNDEGSLVPA